MEKNVPGDDVQTGADGFRRSTPEDRARVKARSEQVPRDGQRF